MDRGSVRMLQGDINRTLYSDAMFLVCNYRPVGNIRVPGPTTATAADTPGQRQCPVQLT